MGTDWKENLKSLFEELCILEGSRKETVEDFDQFCEFVAEPAFEALSDEIKQYGAKAKLKKLRGKSISFKIDFAGSNFASFQYAIVLPEDSVELHLRLQVKGYRARDGRVKEKDAVFMEGIAPSGILKLSKEDIIQDFIENCRVFGFQALTGSE